MRDRARGRVRRSLLQAGLLAAISTLSVLGNADLHTPPRYDGAGYAVLAYSLLDGQGYRALDHPDRPWHDHFPPGYPLLLAALWRATGPSVVAAHLLSAAGTVTAVLAAWFWLRGLYRPRLALGLGLALAVNWTWGRVGAAIQSEPPYLLLATLALGSASWARRRGGGGRGLMVGLLLGAALLTRQVAVCLIVAVGLDLILSGRRVSAALALLASAVIVAPWVAWTWSVGHEPQLGLLSRAGLPDRLASNGLFYLRRMPDALIGPLIEVGTVFQPNWERPATWLAAALSGVVLGGWVRCLRGPRRRLAALAALTTLALLLVWPFTEAGRFLIPLVPLLLVGATEGLAGICRTAGAARPRAWGVALVLLASLPYPVYALATHRAAASRHTHDEFDSACAWLARSADQPGPVLSRHPGEVFLQTGRQGMSPTAEEPDAIDRLIVRYRVAYLLVDDDRYARAPISTLGQYATSRQLVPVWESDQGSIRVYNVAGPAPEP